MSDQNFKRIAKVRNLALIDKQGQETCHLASLRELFRHINYSPYNILSDKKDVPAGLSSRRIWEILNGKRIKYIREDHLEYILKEFGWCNANEVEEKTCLFLGDKQPMQLKEGPKPIPEDILNQLNWYRRNTKTSPKKLLAGNKDFPQGFKIRWVEEWLSGKIKEADEIHLNYVLSKWKELPVIKKTTTGQIIKYDRSGDYMMISQSVRKLLNYNRMRTGMSSRQFLEKHRAHLSELSADTITNWMTGRMKKARKVHLDFVIEKWNSEPDKDVAVSDSEFAPDFKIEKQLLKTNRDRKKTNYVGLDKDVLKEMMVHRKRTGVGPRELLKGAADVPDGLSASVVSAWIDKEVNSSHPEYIAYVLGLWRSLPSSS